MFQRVARAFPIRFVKNKSDRTRIFTMGSEARRRLLVLATATHHERKSNVSRTDHWRRARDGGHDWRISGGGAPPIVLLLHLLNVFNVAPGGLVLRSIWERLLCPDGAKHHPCHRGTGWTSQGDGKRADDPAVFGRAKHPRGSRRDGIDLQCRPKLLASF